MVLGFKLVMYVYSIRMYSTHILVSPDMTNSFLALAISLLLMVFVCLKSDLSKTVLKKDIVELLLTNNADISIKNNEGLKAKDLALDANVKRLVQGE